MKKKYRILFLGTPEFALPSLLALIEDPALTVSLVVTKPDAPVGRAKKLKSTPIKKFALERKIPVITPASLIKNDDKFTAGGSIDIGVVVAYGKLLPPWLLSLPMRGFINIHPSLLPALRGPSPIQTAILQGEKTTGVSFILVDDKMDHGPLLYQEKIVIEENDTYSTLSRKLSALAAQKMSKIVTGYCNNAITPKEQSHDKATYSRLLTKKDGQLNWKNESVALVRTVNSLNPWPGTYTTWSKNILKILQIKPYKRICPTEPGRVRNQSGTITVDTQDGSIELLCVQLEGKKPLRISEFYHGHKNFVGSLLS